MNTPIKLTAEQVYHKLIHEDNIKSVEGQIRFFLGNVDIIVKQKDVVGNMKLCLATPTHTNYQRVGGER